MTLPSHPYANIFPLIEGDAFTQFCDGLRNDDRLHDKIVLLDGQILDGRNRQRACDETGITPHYRTFNPEVEGDPLTFVISKNLHRRHLDDRQRASVAGEIAKLRRGRPSSSDNPPIGGVSAEQAATTLNVAPRQVERSRVVHDQGVPELRDAFRRGDIAISVAEKIARLPEEMQPEAVEKVLPSSARVVAPTRVEPKDSRDYAPTPPWATRALMEIVFPQLGIKPRASVLGNMWEPACGEGHISGVLEEYGSTIASDAFDYSADGRMPPCWWWRLDFLDEKETTPAADWIITNPPFNKAEEFALRALTLAAQGVAMFVRWQWIEGVGRYERLFNVFPPTLVCPFAERVPLHMGRWEPKGVTMTAYCWIVWFKASPSWGSGLPALLRWIPPGQRVALTRPDDAERFTAHPVIRRISIASDGTPCDPVTGEIEDAA